MSAPAIVFTPQLVAVLSVEALLSFGGILLLLRERSEARARFIGAAPSRLGVSPWRPGEIMLAAAFAFGGAIAGQYLCLRLADHLWPVIEGEDRPPLSLLLAGAGFQLGLLAGIGHAWFWHLRPARRKPTPGEPPALPPPRDRLSLPRALAAGALTFLAALPLVWGTSMAWQAALNLIGVEAPPQDIVLLFARGDDPRMIAGMFFFAVLVAPVTEELVFRVGCFAWLRTRAPRGVALLAPAAVFACLHGSVAVLLPLVVLAICLSLAYERSGHPLTPVVAHALFNLNTLLLLLFGWTA